MRKKRIPIGSTTLALAVLCALVFGVSAAYAWAPTLTVNTKFTRTWEWDIAKSVDKSTITLEPGGTATATYSVVVKTKGFTDSGWTVFGTAAFPPEPDVQMNSITATATYPAPAPDVPGTATCPGGLPQILTSALTCSYEIAVPNANSGQALVSAAGIDLTTNTVTGAYDIQPFSFAGATMNEIDECVSVSDTNVGSLGTVCAGDSPKTFTYTKTFGPFTEAQCGDHNFPNTATFTTNDRALTGSASASVKVTVVCKPPETGCTRTPGYWKTHAGFGPQADAVTPLLPISLGTAGGAKTVVVTTAAQAVAILKKDDSSNGIEKLYAHLLAAKLNLASGASGSSIASTIAAADAFLATHNAADWASLSGAQQAMVLGWKDALDAYNNGLSGPGHCGD
jgi:hypothetical protein